MRFNKKVCSLRIQLTRSSNFYNQTLKSKRSSDSSSPQTLSVALRQTAIMVINAIQIYLTFSFCVGKISIKS